MMRPAAIALSLLLAGSVSFAEDTDPEPRAWRKLFNGKDLKGWKVHPKGTGNWKVKDGILVGSGESSHLFSERGDYRNFHFRAEAKIPERSNSGMYFRTKFGAGFPQGWEAQIALGGDSIKTGSLYPEYNRRPDLREHKGLVIQQPLHKADEWFTQEVICKGDHIVIKVNGKTTVDWKDPKGRFKKGHFALQQHNPNSTVRFRKVEVKELPDDR